MHSAGYVRTMSPASCQHRPGGFGAGVCTPSSSEHPRWRTRSACSSESSRCRRNRIAELHRFRSPYQALLGNHSD